MKLLFNEFIKDYKKKTTWIYMLIMFAIIGAFGYFQKSTMGDNFEPTTILLSVTKVAVAIGGVFTLIMLANNLSQEYSKGTVKFLYTRPKSRSAILTAKIALGFINYIIFFVLGTAFDFAIKYYVFFNKKIGLNQLNKTLEEGYFGRTVAKQLIITSLTELATMIFFIAMVVLLCVVFKTQILSLVLVMVSLLGMSIIQAITGWAVTKWSWAKYHMFDVPLFSYYYESEASRKVVREIFKFDNANALIIMLVAYSAVFFVISYIINARRDITID